MQTSERIRILRDMKGFSQDNMAAMLGLSRQAYGDIERGKTNLSESRLNQIAKTLGTTAKDIHNFEDKMADFFDQCTNFSPTGADTQKTPQNDQRELQFLLEKAQLSTDKLLAQLCKAQLEATYWREKYEREVSEE